MRSPWRGAEEEEDSTKAEVEPAAALRYGPDIKDNIDQLEFSARRMKRDAWTHPLTGIRGDLMPHQQEALEWLKGLWNGGVPGALLADDMGLGKTLQCISFLSWVAEGYKKQDLRPRCLVVAPAGLIANWQAEVKQWAPDVLGDALVLTGNALNELNLRSGEKHHYIDNLSTFPCFQRIFMGSCAQNAGTLRYNIVLYNTINSL